MHSLHYSVRHILQMSFYKALNFCIAEGGRTKNGVNPW